MRKIITYLIFILFLFFILASFTPLSIAKQKPLSLTDPPILRIDTGGHKAIIRDIFFTRDGRYLVSVSDDKTVRVWDIQTGKTVRIIRGQIGKGHEGKIFAAALSPNEQWLAVGGWMDSAKNYKLIDLGAIRIIDFVTGHVKELLKGHEGAIHAISFSSDNRLLISGSSDKTARIWDIATGRWLHTLSGHKQNIYAAAFSPDNSLAITGSLDHTLKLWREKDGKLIATLEGHEDHVVSAAFTPDGKYILSGSFDKSIRLWDGKTGKFIKMLARQNRGVASLSISPDGKMVLTGTGQLGTGSYTNNVFSIPSGNPISQFDKHTNIVVATAISPDSTNAATGGGGDKEMYIWDIKTGREKKKMVGKGRGVWSVGFSKDGRAIAWGNTWEQSSLFGYGPLEKSFIISTSTGETGPGPDVTNDSGFVRAIEKKDDISIRTKDGKVHPTLQILKKGKVVHEITRDYTDSLDHRSLTLTPDGKTVISGGAWGTITAYDTQTAKKLRQYIGHTFTVWGVAVAPDGRLLVSGSDDQTVKLWEVETGKLLMTLFYGTDDEWVVWTEEGFFDASQNGARYVGYHINRGEDRAADYVGVDQVYDLFYRPDLVAKRIQGGFEKEISAELARIGSIDEVIASGLPPEVTILTDNNARVNQRDFTLYFSLKDKGGGIGRVEYRVNDVLVASTEEIRSEDVYTQRRSGRIPKHFTLPEGTNKVTVTTYNKKGTIASEPAQITVHVKDPLSEAPELYVLAVGVSEYRDRNLWLKFAHTDAQDVADELENRGKGLFSDVHVMHLVNKEATTSAIEKTFDSLSKKIKTSDVFVLYLAGHGMAVSGRYHFIPWEAVYDTTSEALAQASLSHDKIIGLLEKIPALKSLIILDTCYAGMAAKLGSQVNVASLRGIEEKTAIDKLMRTSGRTFLAASSENQPAIEGYKGHGVFTFALIQGLEGEADRKGRGEGVITIDELADYVRQEVPKITSKKWGYEIIPMRNIMGDPFPIGCRQGARCRP